MKAARSWSSTCRFRPLPPSDGRVRRRSQAAMADVAGGPRDRRGGRGGRGDRRSPPLYPLTESLRASHLRGAGVRRDRRGHAHSAGGEAANRAAVRWRRRLPQRHSVLGLLTYMYASSVQRQCTVQVGSRSVLIGTELTQLGIDYRAKSSAGDRQRPGRGLARRHRAGLDPALDRALPAVGLQRPISSGSPC